MELKFTEVTIPPLSNTPDPISTRDLKITQHDLYFILGNLPTLEDIAKSIELEKETNKLIELLKKMEK